MKLLYFFELPFLIRTNELDALSAQSTADLRSHDIIEQIRIHKAFVLISGALFRVMTRQ